MFYLLHHLPIREGGPDFECVCGIFSSRDKAENAKNDYKTFMKLDFYEERDFDDDKFSIIQCNGPYTVEISYDIHGEQQNEVDGTFSSGLEAADHIDRHRERYGDKSWSVNRYDIDEVIFP